MAIVADGAFDGEAGVEDLEAPGRVDALHRVALGAAVLGEDARAERGGRPQAEYGEGGLQEVVGDLPLPFFADEDGGVVDGDLGGV